MIAKNFQIVKVIALKTNKKAQQIIIKKIKSYHCKQI